MPTKDSKIISIRVPNRVDFSEYNAGKLIACFYDMVRCGALKIEKDEIVLPEGDCEMCAARKVYEEIKEICHDKNVSIDSFMKMVRR